MQKMIIVAALAAGSAYALSGASPKTVALAKSSGRAPDRTASIGAGPSAPGALAPQAAASALKSRLRCTMVTSLPLTISAPGRYCYGADLSTSSFSGVRIEASDVTLDCAGFRTTSSLPRSGGSDGIYTAGEVRNVTIRNCRVGGFDRGITAFAGAVGTRILDNHVDAAQTMGIGAWGDGAQVIGNRVTNTHPAEPGQYANGISLLPVAPETPARNQVVARNVVVNVYGSAQTTGIVVSGSTAPKIVGNTILSLRPDEGGHAIGLWLSGWAQGARTTSATVADNQLMTRPSASYTDFAAETIESATSCTGNVTIGVSASNLWSCPSGEDTVVVP